MAYSTQNIIVGAAAVFLSDKDSDHEDFAPGSAPKNFTGIALPAAPAPTAAGTSIVTALESSAEWNNVGYTTEGVEFSYEPDFGEVQVDQMLDVAKMFKQGMRASVNTTFAEATLTNLMIAWGQSKKTLAGDNVLTVSAGALGDEPVERSITFVGLAPRKAGKKQERIYYLRRALQVEASNHSLSRNDATTIPVSFRLLPEAHASGADYGTVTDRAMTT